MEFVYDSNCFALQNAIVHVVGNRGAISLNKFGPGFRVIKRDYSILTKLTGPVRLLPGKQAKRAKSLDDYEQPHLEEVASMPQSRDASQTRYGVGHRKGSDHQVEPIGGRHLFVKSAGIFECHCVLPFYPLLQRPFIGCLLLNVTFAPKCATNFLLCPLPIDSGIDGTG